MQQARQRRARYWPAIAGEVQPMAGKVGEQALHVLRQHVVATLHQCPGARDRQQPQPGAWAEAGAEFGIVTGG